jgi:hypothetical protein
MPEPTAIIIYAVFAVGAWLAWAFFSETRHNHGFLVAFLLPLALIFIPVFTIIFVFFKYSSYVFFILIGRREDHKEFMEKLKIRFGCFPFF